MNSSDFLQLLVAAVLIGTLTGYLAKERGRDPIKWFLIGMLCGIFALIALYLFPVVEDKEQKNEREAKVLPPASSQPVEDELSAKPWFYLDQKHVRYGPEPLDTLKLRFKDGDINKRTYVWSEGMEGWKRIEDLPDILEQMSSDKL